MSLSADLIRYAETFSVSVGHGEGEPLKLLEWQRSFIREMFADGISEAALSVGRANGKSALLGAILAACVDPNGPLFAKGAVNIVIASVLSQARETFMFARRMLAQKHDLTSRRDWSVTDSTNSVRLIHRASEATVRALSANPQSAHGLGNFKLALLDEPAQWEKGKSDVMYAAVDTALGKMPDSRIVAIGTRPESPDHWFSVLLDKDAEGRYRKSYSVPRETGDVDVLKRSVWLAANPSAKHWPVLDAALRKAASDAKEDPRKLQMFKSLRANMGVADVTRSVLLEADEWERSGAKQSERGSEVLWGIDLGHNRSGSAIAAYWPETHRAEALLALPSIPELTDRERKDGAPKGLYVNASEDGSLLVLGKRTPDVKALISQAVERFGAPTAIACDAWKRADLDEAIEDAGISPEVEERRQGWHHSGEDCEALRMLVGEDQFHPVRTPIWDWSMSRAITRSDHVANVRLEKRHGDDIAVASSLVAGLAKRRGQADEDDRYAFGW